MNEETPETNNLPNKHLFLSARIEHIWEETMKAAGYKEFCASTTQFNWISYNYTSDAPQSCIEFGEKLWLILFEWLGRDGVGGQVEIGKDQMMVVTRDRNLWNK